jgi:hypothetical protein
LWIPESASTYYIRASWSGDDDYAGADSDIQTLIVIPVDWIFIFILSAVSASIILVVGIIVVLKRRIPMEETFSDEENPSHLQNACF